MISGSSTFGSNLDLLQASMQALRLRQQVHAHNLANANTPGYQRKTVEFSDTLAQMAAANARQSDDSGSTMSHLTPMSDAAAGAGQLMPNFKVTTVAGDTLTPGTQQYESAESNAMLKDMMTYRAVTQQASSELRELKSIINETGRS